MRPHHDFSHLHALLKDIPDRREAKQARAEVEHGDARAEPDLPQRPSPIEMGTEREPPPAGQPPNPGFSGTSQRGAEQDEHERGRDRR